VTSSAATEALHTLHIILGGSELGPITAQTCTQFLLNEPSFQEQAFYPSCHSTNSVKVPMRTQSIYSN